MEDQEFSLLAMTSRIAAAYLGNHLTASSEIPALIRMVHDGLAGMGRPTEPTPAELVPAVPIRKSVLPDYIVCLEDGKHLKMLKRHLRTAYDLSPDEYRLKWGLPSTYPMVAPNYSKQRSGLAKQIGLGTRTAQRGKGKAVTAVPGPRRSGPPARKGDGARRKQAT